MIGEGKRRIAYDAEATDLEARFEESRRERTTTTSDGGIRVESVGILIATEEPEPDGRVSEWERTHRIEADAPTDGEADEPEPPPSCLH